MVPANTETHRPAEQKDGPDGKPCIHGQVIFYSGAKDTHWGKDGLFNKWYWENWISTYKRMKLDLYLTSHIKINSKWTKDLTIRSKTIKSLEENRGKAS